MQESNVEREPANTDLQIRQFVIAAPAVFSYACVQCDATWTALVYGSQGILELALFSEQLGGAVTVHTPPGVAFYLDQAARCHSSNAHSAALTMFRSALEWLLEDQGFTESPLGRKLAALEKAIQAGKAPKWIAEVDPEFVAVIKNLGNTAAHTNAGDLTKQNRVDAELYRGVETTFLELLDAIYERPRRRQQRLEDLKNAL